jgi:hypothetical protein
VGEDRVVEPGAATTSLPYLEFGLVFVGRGGALVAVAVDAGSLSPVQPDPRGAVTRTPATITSPIELTASQRRVLLALCEPLLTCTGAAASPPTYAQIGRRLGRQPQYTRNVIKSIRESLSGYGIPGLTASYGSEGNEDFRLALARWAIRSGWVNIDSLHMLPPAPCGSGAE